MAADGVQWHNAWSAARAPGPRWTNDRPPYRPERLPDADALGIHMAWPETHDHAKWAITKDNNWVCVGDINRNDSSQRKRGHGTIAFPVPAALEGPLEDRSRSSPRRATSRDEARALIQKTHVNPDAPPHAKKHAGRVAFARSALARLRSNSFEPP